MERSKTGKNPQGDSPKKNTQLFPTMLASIIDGKEKNNGRLTPELSVQILRQIIYKLKQENAIGLLGLSQINEAIKNYPSYAAEKECKPCFSDDDRMFFGNSYRMTELYTADNPVENQLQEYGKLVDGKPTLRVFRHLFLGLDGEVVTFEYLSLVNDITIGPANNVVVSVAEDEYLKALFVAHPKLLDLILEHLRKRVERLRSSTLKRLRDLSYVDTLFDVTQETLQ
jgi:hypothetical protein